MKEKITVELMKALSNIYKKPSIINKVCSMRRLFHLKMGKDASLVNYINEFNVIISQVDFD